MAGLPTIHYPAHLIHHGAASLNTDIRAANYCRDACVEIRHSMSDAVVGFPVEVVALARAGHEGGGNIIFCSYVRTVGKPSASHYFLSNFKTMPPPSGELVDNTH